MALCSYLSVWRWRLILPVACVRLFVCLLGLVLDFTLFTPTTTPTDGCSLPGLAFAIWGGFRLRFVSQEAENGAEPDYSSNMANLI